MNGYSDSEQDCIDQCDEYDECVGIVYRIGDGYCWLKNVLETQTANTLYNNAARATATSTISTTTTTTASASPSASLCATETTEMGDETGYTYHVCDGANRPGNDLSVSTASDINDCIQQCDAQTATAAASSGVQACAGVAFDTSTNNCYLKQYLNALVADSDYDTASPSS